MGFYLGCIWCLHIFDTFLLWDSTLFFWGVDMPEDLHWIYRRWMLYCMGCIYHMGCFLFNQSWRFLKLASHPNRHGGHINYGPSVETQMPVDIRASTLRQDQPDSWRRKKWGWLMQPSIPKQKKL